jgi:hypothetical protein
MVFREKGQDLKRFGAQRDFFAAVPQCSMLHVQCEIAKRVLAGDLLFRIWLRAAQAGLALHDALSPILFHYFHLFFHPIIITSETLSP